MDVALIDEQDVVRSGLEAWLATELPQLGAEVLAQGRGGRLCLEHGRAFLQRGIDGAAEGGLALCNCRAARSLGPEAHRLRDALHRVDVRGGELVELDADPLLLLAPPILQCDV